MVLATIFSATFTVATGFGKTAGGELGPAILQPANAAATICAVVLADTRHLCSGGKGFAVLLTVVFAVDVEADVFCCVAVAHTKT